MDSTTPLDVHDLIDACTRVVVSTGLCVEALQGDPVSSGLCGDAHDSAVALRHALERRMVAERHIGVRRMVEAALITMVECAGNCREMSDSEPVPERCATDCESAADRLREFLRQLDGASHDETSGAT
jgi:hypothetical protein